VCLGVDQGSLRPGFDFAKIMGSEFRPEGKNIAPETRMAPESTAEKMDHESAHRRAEGEGIILDLKGKANILLNLKYLSEIDSTGLGTLVFGLARLRKAGGRPALVNLDRSHLELFLLSKLAIAL
jgi:anti-anti-sigma factor